MEVKVFNKDGSETGTVTLSDAVFGLEPKAELVHQYIVNYLANQRQGNSSSKGRSDVAGGGAKPWRQKGTGRARVGTIRSPLWRGGGITFGPSPRSYYNRFPRKMKRLAMKSALSDKARDEKLMVVEDLQLEQIKTRQMVDILDKLGLKDRKCLILDDGRSENLLLSIRNLPRVAYTWAPQANAYEIVNAEVLLFTKAGLEKIEEVLAR
jgi:large subunit ribosomal protein L4